MHGVIRLSSLRNVLSVERDHFIYDLYYTSIYMNMYLILGYLQVFTSWPNRTSSAAAPVDSSLIHQLKKLARLLHFCSSHLLLCPATPATSVEQATWFNSVQNEVLSLYIQYLKTLNFEEITERATTAPPPRHKGSGGHTPTRSHPQAPPLLSVPPQKLYKCMQRSWSHGIILVELTFHEERFDVKLLTLESSRLNGQKSLSPEVRTVAI